MSGHRDEQRFPTNFGSASTSRSKASALLFYGHSKAARLSRTTRGLPTDVPGTPGTKSFQAGKERPTRAPKRVCHWCRGNHKSRAHAKSC